MSNVMHVCFISSLSYNIAGLPNFWLNVMLYAPQPFGNVKSSQHKSILSQVVVRFHTNRSQGYTDKQFLT